MFKPETRASCFTHKFDSIGFNLITNTDIFIRGKGLLKRCKIPIKGSEIS